MVNGRESGEMDRRRRRVRDEGMSGQLDGGIT